MEDTQKIKRSEDAAKSRMMKKYSKQVQVQKLQDRAKAKNAAIDKIKLLRKGKKNIGNGLGDDFEVSVDDDDKPKRDKKEKKEKRDQKDQKREGGEGNRQAGKPQLRGKTKKRLIKVGDLFFFFSPARDSSCFRVSQDQKFGHGGKKRYSKSNTAESTDHFGSGVKKTRTGLPPKSVGSKVTKKRLGKSKRQNFKGKNTGK